MLLTPFVIQYSDTIATKILYLFNGKKENEILNKLSSDNKKSNNLQNHLVIIGYGINGQNLVRVANQSKIPYVIIESNVEIVQREKKNGKSIIFGDATDSHTLHMACIENARVIVIAISDSKATKQVISCIRVISQSVHVIIRTKDVDKIDGYIDVGADEVISEKFEASIEIFSRVLHNYLVPIHRLESLINTIRSDNYKSLQTKKELSSVKDRALLPNFNIVSIRLLADSGRVVGKTIIESDIRKEFGVSILAILRDEKMINTIRPNDTLSQNDIVYISGNVEDIEHFYNAVS